jgi:adenylosuccinate synthase
MLRHAVRVNGLTELVLTKLDILSGLEQLPVCVAYEVNGRRLEHLPTDAATLAQCRPVYESLDGWEVDIMAARAFGDLPANGRRYVQTIAETIEIPVTYVSVGPGRSQIIEVE